MGCGLAHYHLHVATLFEEEGASEYVVDACNAALLEAAEMVGSLPSLTPRHTNVTVGRCATHFGNLAEILPCDIESISV